MLRALFFTLCLVAHVASQGSCTYDGSLHDFQGTDVASTTYTGNTDADKDSSCALQCNQNPNCQYWVRATDSSTCWLKTTFVGYVSNGNRRGNFRSAVTSFAGGVFELQSANTLNYVMGPGNPSEGALFITWYQGLADFGQPSREQIQFASNADGTYKLVMASNTGFCVRWYSGVFTVSGQSTTSDGSIKQSQTCTGDDAKWYVTPTCVNGLNYYQLKNKASNTCLSRSGSGNSFPFGMQSCTSALSNSFILPPYATTTTTISGPSSSSFGSSEIGRAVQQECRDRSRMPSSA
eukprot:TRINITY_DN1880_c0_g1_i2.p1 TRINITY_DN1880_c0_g1~~TRINITY_DN1880_c0_g1_i2.p1  ORF type:complete len:293 (+),score=29.53 TRINITY_DN1880_c0_g1_i2:115-993(+)